MSQSYRIAAFAVALVVVCHVRSATGVPVTSGLGFHLRADQGVTGTGSSVAQWNDLSGQNNHFVQGNGSVQPQLVTNVLNGQPGIRFTSDRLTAITGHTLANSSALPFTFFAVTAGTSNPRALFDSAPGSPQVFRFYADNNVELWANSPAIAFPIDSAGTVMALRAEAVSGVRQLEARKYTTSGVTGSSASGNTSPVAFTTPDIGTVNGGSAGFYNGDLLEMVYYNRRLNNVERNVVEHHLISRYGRPGQSLYAGGEGGQGNYDFDVFGIGQEADGNVLSADSGNGLSLTALNGSFGNGEYVLAGNQSGGNSMLAGDLKRWERVWYVDETSSDGVDVMLTFDFDDAGLPMVELGAMDEFVLLHSATSSLAFTALAAAAVVSGNTVSFVLPAGLLNDGFYTLGLVQVPEPCTLVLTLGLAVVLLPRRRRK